MTAKTHRREFLKRGAGGLAAAWLLQWAQERAYAYSQSPGLQKFVQPLPGVGPGGIPVASAIPDPVFPNTDFYQLVAGQFTQQLHPALPKPTALWGYGDALTPGVFRHLGPVIVAQRGRAVRIRMSNQLPPSHILPVDTTIPGAELAQNRITVHLHGGFSPWNSDGGPFSWFTPDGTTGPSFANAGGNPGQADYYYPNAQSARMMWYHDHALGITRLNAYAGLASAYVLRDAAEAALVSRSGLPTLIENGGTHELPLVIQDKIFVPQNIAAVDPTWRWGAPGDLWYAHVYERNRWTLQGTSSGGGTNLPPPDPSCVPEFFGDTMLVNGVVYPTVNVEPRRYRFRVLNACNARFCNLQLFVQDNSVDGITLGANGLPTNPAGPAFVQIGTEGGFLPAPVVLNNPPIPFNPITMTGNLLLAPAERADILVDFSTLPVGTRLILYSDTPAPFPGGDPRNDYFPGAPKNPTITTLGFGPNTRQLMQFVVVKAVTPPDRPLNLTLPPVDPPLLVPAAVTALPPGIPVRSLTLNEDFDAYGRLIQRLGTNVQLYKGTFARNYGDAPTETPVAGSTEVWQIANVTADTHPIHFHLVNAQIISRQPFKASSYNGVPSYTGPARAPELNERGWKETIRMNPGEVTTVIMQFNLPSTPFTVPPSPRTGGNEYVWHCHILEHEEHDMMRPLIVF